MRTALTTGLVGVVVAAVGVASAPAVSATAPTMTAYAARAAAPDVAPGRFATVRIGDSLESAGATEYFDLNVPSACGRMAIAATKPWRRSIDIYRGWGKMDKSKVASIGIFKAGIPTTEGVEVGDTISDLEEAYGDKLIGPTVNDYDQYSYFVRSKKRWLGFATDSMESDGDPDSSAEIVFMEITKGRRPGVVRDGC